MNNLKPEIRLPLISKLARVIMFLEVEMMEQRT